MNLVPMVVESDSRGERGYDIYSRLLKDRIVFLGDDITDDVANSMIAQFLFLAGDNPEQEISLYINSHGGSITAGLAIIDTMDIVPCPVATYCIGQAASMAAVILSAGTKGRRFVLPNSRVMIHQPSVHGLRGQATDIAIFTKELLDMREQLNTMLAANTGQTVERIAADVERDYIMRANAAVEYGIVDKIYRKKKNA